MKAVRLSALSTDRLYLPHHCIMDESVASHARFVMVVDFLMCVVCVDVVSDIMKCGSHTTHRLKSTTTTKYTSKKLQTHPFK